MKSSLALQGPAFVASKAVFKALTYSSLVVKIIESRCNEEEHVLDEQPRGKIGLAKWHASRQVALLSHQVQKQALSNVFSTRYLEAWQKSCKTFHIHLKHYIYTYIYLYYIYNIALS